jgi:uncharacterized membrane protein YhaH (DUF805 family)
MNQDEWGELERAAHAHRPRPREPQGLELWLSPRGRIARSTYWLKFALPITGLQLLGAVVDLASGVRPDGFGPARALMFVATFWPGIVASVKRLHDLGHPGWFVGVFYGGTLGLGLALAVAVPLLGTVGLLVGIPWLVLALGATWYSLKMMFARGTPGPNQYGPDPLVRRGPA